jgi:hypothetical protein
MKPGPSAVAQIILSELPIDAPPEALETVITRVIAGRPEWQCAPEDKAALWTPSVKLKLEKHWDLSIKLGRQPRFSFNTVSDYKIQGGCFIEPLDPPEVKEQKRRRLRWKDYYDCLQAVSPEMFERMCAYVLRLLGVPTPVLTPYRADQGIDFFGRISVADLTGHGPLFPVFETDLVVWLVGQAKHYRDSKVSTPDVRALAGSVFLGRARAFPKEGVLPQLNIRTCDPVIMLFFTTGQISTDGWELCRRAGIVPMDGERLAAFLADKQVGLIGDGEMRQFSRSALAEALGVQAEELGSDRLFFPNRPVGRK